MQPTVFLVAVLALALGACAGVAPREAPPTPATGSVTPPYTLERFRGENKIAAGIDTLVIENAYGDVQVRQTSARAIAWQGVEQRIGEKPRIARIDPVQQGRKQGIAVRYAEHDPWSSLANPRLGRVDLFVFVPKGLRIDVRSGFGGITIRRLDNDVRARSVSGMIVAASRGALDAESETGEIRAYAMQSAGESPTRIRTRANVVADIPVFDDVRVEVESARGIRADFDMADIAQLPSGRWRASWTHGSGVHRMSIVSDGGDVVLQSLKKPVP